MTRPTRLPAPVTMAVLGSGRHGRLDCVGPRAMTRAQPCPRAARRSPSPASRWTALAAAIGERRTPPVDRWDPPLCGHSGMRIAADGTWFHEGAPITRPAMVRLFCDRAAPRAGRQPRARHAARETDDRRRRDAVSRHRHDPAKAKAKSGASPSSWTAATPSSSAPATRSAWSRTSTGRARASPCATGSRRCWRGRSITSWPTSRSPRATTRPASGATDASSPLR